MGTVVCVLSQGVEKYCRQRWLVGDSDDVYMRVLEKRLQIPTILHAHKLLFCSFQGGYSVAFLMFVRRRFHVWRLMCHHLCLISPSLLLRKALLRVCGISWVA